SCVSNRGESTTAWDCALASVLVPGTAANAVGTSRSMERTASDLAARLKARALELGFDRAGIAPVRPSDHAAFYGAWLDAGRHGTMRYLARPDAVERRLDPQAAWPELRSALVVAQHYDPGDDDDVAADPARAVIARYARGRDYHKLIKPKLLSLLRWLEAEV